MAPRKAKKAQPKAEKGSRADAGELAGCPVILETGCLLGEPIDAESPGDAIRIVCTNEACPMGDLIHGECYDVWEDHLVKILSSVSWARSWTEAQKRANLWDKKGYLLIQKLCRCRCAAGKLRRDLDYKAPLEEGEAEAEKRKRGPRKQLPSLCQAERVSRRPLGSPKTGSPSTLSRAASFDEPIESFTSKSLEHQWLRSRVEQPAEPSLGHFIFSPKTLRSLNLSHKSGKSTDSGLVSPSSPLSPKTSPIIQSEMELVDELRAVVGGGSAVSESDRRVVDILSRLAPPVAQAVEEAGGFSAFVEAASEGSGLGLFADSHGTAWLFLEATHLCTDFRPPSGAEEMAAPPGLEVAGSSLDRTLKGVIQNVFPRYGYIECPELDSNVFFVPSHVVCPITGDSLKDVVGAEGLPSLSDRLRRGQVVEFAAVRQEEKSGCRWMARWVVVLGASPFAPPTAPASPVSLPPSTPRRAKGPPPPLIRTASQPVMSTQIGAERRDYGLFGRGLGLGEALLASLDALGSPASLCLHQQSLF